MSLLILDRNNIALELAEIFAKCEKEESPDKIIQALRNILTPDFGYEPSSPKIGDLISDIISLFGRGLKKNSPERLFVCENIIAKIEQLRCVLTPEQQAECPKDISSWLAQQKEKILKSKEQILETKEKNATQVSVHSTHQFTEEDMKFFAQDRKKMEQIRAEKARGEERRWIRQQRVGFISDLCGSFFHAFSACCCCCGRSNEEEPLLPESNRQTEPTHH